MICPKCGSETRTGWWLRWCTNTKRCKWVRRMSKEEREAEREALIEELTEQAIITEVTA